MLSKIKNPRMPEDRVKDLVSLKMVILNKRDGGYHMRISHKGQKAWLHYDPGDKKLKIMNGGQLAKFLHQTSRIETFQTQQQSSNLIELMAVIQRLKMTRKYQRVQVVTDSQYVIKGISRWIYHWKLNRWKTANGRRVKNKKQWKQLD